jgi:hypothetical protein
VNQEAAEYQIDDLLLPFLTCPSEAESETILTQLVLKHARPLITEIISFKLKAYSSRSTHTRDDQEVEDISSEVVVRLVRVLRLCKSSPQEKAIASLRGYVAAMAYNASDQYLRQKYPRRFSLKNRVRYILAHQSGLAVWEGDGREVLCGFSSWRQSKKGGAGSLRQAQGRGVLDAFLQKRFGDRPLEQVNPADLVGAVLEFAGSPLEIDDLVSVLADICQVRDAPPEAEGDSRGHAERGHLSSDPRASLDAAFDHKQRLSRVWEEILQLAPRQRAALLLNLRDDQGGAAIVLLPMLRVASIEQIAEALEMGAEELAAIWGDLPMEDAIIGERLGATRQQVSNLRKCARERLSRRLMAHGNR